MQNWIWNCNKRSIAQHLQWHFCSYFDSVSNSAAPSVPQLITPSLHLPEDTNVHKGNVCAPCATDTTHTNSKFRRQTMWSLRYAKLCQAALVPRWWVQEWHVSGSRAKCHEPLLRVPWNHGWNHGWNGAQNSSEGRRSLALLRRFVWRALWSKLNSLDLGTKRSSSSSTRNWPRISVCHFGIKKNHGRI